MGLRRGKSSNGTLPRRVRCYYFSLILNFSLIPLVLNFLSEIRQLKKNALISIKKK